MWAFTNQRKRFWEGESWGNTFVFGLKDWYYLISSRFFKIFNYSSRKNKRFLTTVSQTFKFHSASALTTSAPRWLKVKLRGGKQSTKNSANEWPTAILTAKLDLLSYIFECRLRAWARSSQWHCSGFYTGQDSLLWLWAMLFIIPLHCLCEIFLLACYTEQQSDPLKRL